MSASLAVVIAAEQLQYWQVECKKAHEAGDAERIEHCERFIAQCEVVIAALHKAALA